MSSFPSLSTKPVQSAHKLTQVQGLSSIAGTELASVSKMVSVDKYPSLWRDDLGRMSNACQTRSFLGCVDGEEGDILSKNYEEKRVIGYSPEQLFAVVAAVDLYQDFVPWCQQSKIVRHNVDGSFDAELQIGFKFFVESYMSHVEMKKHRHIKTTASESGLFDHLINIWEFDPGPIPGTCNLHFLVDFRFQSPLYRQVASMFFKEVVSKLVGSFSDRCRSIYGPGVRVLETEYGAT
ncbi:Coenzyme Q-binding COQ10-like protein [Nymphaea thermarum]|nr:Coenzyme Q-binding COQ10-like protein [Nymphaea thermarum]